MGKACSDTKDGLPGWDPVHRIESQSQHHPKKKLQSGLQQHQQGGKRKDLQVGWQARYGLNVGICLVISGCIAAPEQGILPKPKLRVQHYPWQHLLRDLGDPVNLLGMYDDTGKDLKTPRPTKARRPSKEIMAQQQLLQHLILMLSFILHNDQRKANSGLDRIRTDFKLCHKLSSSGAKSTSAHYKT